MSPSSSASGERSALSGYEWQYRNAARLTYDALLDRDLKGVCLVDPEAGRLDDFIITRSGGTDAYQFKSRTGRSLTFKALAGTDESASGSVSRSLISDLAMSWHGMRARFPGLRAHLITNQAASVHDRLPGTDECETPRHFKAFLDEVLGPLSTHELDFADIRPKWMPAVRRLESACQLPRQDSRDFLRSLTIGVDSSDGFDGGSAQQRRDLEDLKSLLMSEVADAPGKVELDSRQILQRLGWTQRVELQATHLFPFNPDAYAPLSEPLRHVEDLLNRVESGYIALTGPPGSGKSTLLSQAFLGSRDRVLHHYAHVPGRSTNRIAMTAEGFLHDACLRLEGRRAADHFLPLGNVNALRQRFAGCLQEASRRFESTGERTLIVVDGLDHVEREELGNEALLGELPPVAEVPRGVIFVIGSRTLNALRDDARTWLQLNSAHVDLSGHHLQIEAVLDICSRAPVVKDMNLTVHERIAERTGGYPLALAYALNHLAMTTVDPVEALEALPLYDDDIVLYYEQIWAGHGDQPNVIRLLGFLSRLRIAVDARWIRDRLGESLNLTFQQQLAYLFSKQPDGYRFFHDSFRQYAARQTALLHGDGDATEGDRYAQRQLAALLDNTADARYAPEALFHWWQAGDAEEVLSRASQSKFREQFRQLRPPYLIKQDIELSLRLAADNADALKMLELSLAYMELNSRVENLAETDVPLLLFDTGRVAAALEFCVDSGGEQTSTVFEIARRLGDLGDPAGRRVFDQAEAGVLLQGGDSLRSARGDQLPDSYVRAATQFRPIERVLTALANHRDARFTPQASEHRCREAWRDYCGSLHVLVRECRASSSWEALSEIIRACEDALAALRSSDDADVDADWLQGVTVAAMLALLPPGGCDQRADEIISTPVMQAAIGNDDTVALKIAELLHRSGQFEAAADIVGSLDLNRQIVAADLSYDSTANAIHRRFRYWRLVHLLETSLAEVPVSIAPTSETPGGDHLPSSASMHQDHDVIAMASVVDKQVRDLARLHARTEHEARLSDSEVIFVLRTCLTDLQMPHIQSGMNGYKVIEIRQTLAPFIAEAAISYGDRVARALASRFGEIFAGSARRWPLPLQLKIADLFDNSEITVEWRDTVVERMRASLAGDDVDGTLSRLGELAEHYLASGQPELARKVTDEMIARSLAVGYRKDYQFERWGEWLASTVRDLDPSQARKEVSWLARLLRAVQPMCETRHPPGTDQAIHAAALTDPLLSVRIFEYFVRNGLTQHGSSLGALLVRLVEHWDPRDELLPSVALKAYLQMVLPVIGDPKPHMAAAPRLIVGRIHQSQADRARDFCIQALETIAVPSARRTWCELLDIAADALRASALYDGPEDAQVDASASPSGNWGSLEPSDVLPLQNGDRYTLADLLNSDLTAAQIAVFRAGEADNSTFEWHDVLERTISSIDDVELLRPVFARRDYRDLRCCVVLAEGAERHGSPELAAELCRELFSQLTEDDLSDSRYDSGLRVASLLIRLEGDDVRADVCGFLAHHMLRSSWSMPLLLPNLRRIFRVIEPELDAAEAWGLVKFHLEGIAHGLELDDDEALADHGTRWWLPGSPTDERAAAPEPGVDAAVGELLVGHLSHPTWLLRDAAIRLTAEAIGEGNKDVLAALMRFGRSTSHDYASEGIGRCLSAVASLTSGNLPTELEPLRDRLARSDNHLIRELAPMAPSRPSKPLPTRYRVMFAPPPTGIGSVLPKLAPYRDMYRAIAQVCGIPLDTLWAVATQYFQEALEAHPSQDEVKHALSGAGVRMGAAISDVWASRAAYGRLLGDLVDAQVLPNPPYEVWRGLRGMDLDALTRVPSPRPPIVLRPPAVIDYPSRAEWCDGLEDSLARHAGGVTEAQQRLIGAKSESVALSHGRYDERVELTSVVGDVAPESPFVTLDGATLEYLSTMTSPRMPEPGEPLIIYSHGHPFCQLNAEWLAFRPDIATALDWQPDSTHPGTWLTRDGLLAVETVWWADGLTNIHYYSTDGYAAEGHVVILSAEGLHDIEAAVGPVTAHLTVTRGSYDDIEEAARGSAHRAIHL